MSNIKSGGIACLQTLLFGGIEEVTLLSRLDKRRGRAAIGTGNSAISTGEVWWHLSVPDCRCRLPMGPLGGTGWCSLCHTANTHATSTPGALCGVRQTEILDERGSPAAVALELHIEIVVGGEGDSQAAGCDVLRKKVPEEG